MTLLALPLLVSRGEARLENWAAWCLRFNPGVDYPSHSPVARLYVPPAGGVWEDVATDEGRPLSANSEDAERVEAWIVDLKMWERRLLKLAYLHQHPLWRCAQILRTTREGAERAHAELCVRAAHA